MEVIIDIQGFRGVFDEFLIKESACIQVNTYSNEYQGLQCVLFEPPYKWDALSKKSKNINSWLIEHFHGILWESGDTPYADLKKVVERIVINATVIYVKGVEKQKFLKEIIDTSKPVVNLEDFKCLKLTN